MTRSRAVRPFAIALVFALGVAACERIVELTPSGDLDATLGNNDDGIPDDAAPDDAGIADSDDAIVDDASLDDAI